MKKAAIALLIANLLLLIGQAVGGMYGTFVFPLALIVLTVLPPLYLVLYLTSGKKIVFTLAYAIIALVLLFGVRAMNMTGNESVKIVGPLLLVLQAGLWIQYYFWDRHKPEALTQGGNFDVVEREKIRALLTAGRLEDAMDKMTAGDELSAEQQTVVSNFAYRLNEIKRKETMGLLTDDDATVERNKVVTGILSFL